MYAWVTWPEQPKDAKDEVKRARLLGGILIVDHVDHAVSADHTGQVDPADCGGLADHANIYQCVSAVQLS